jgi:hypothetical protein
MTMDCEVYGFMNFSVCSSRFIGKIVIAFEYAEK